MYYSYRNSNFRALALNCNAKIDDEKGATAVNWKKGKPVRVVRNYRLYSKYAPKLGNRYESVFIKKTNLYLFVIMLILRFFFSQSCCK